MFPSIERSAGLSFRTIPALAWIADDDDLPVEFHQRLIARGTSWTATDDLDQPVGFLSAEVFSDDLHIWELSVRRDRQRQGIGRQLIERAIEEAVVRELVSITLTTFHHVPWNAPFYAKLGFQILRSRDIGPRLAGLLQDEAERGLALEMRCAMRLIIEAEAGG